MIFGRMPYSSEIIPLIFEMPVLEDRMGCGQKAAAMAYEAEASWRENLAGGKKVLHEKISDPLLEVMNTEAFTKDEFNKLDQARRILMEVTGEQRYW